MTEYSFAMNTVEGKIGVDVMCRAVFEYKGQQMEIVNTYHDDNGQIGERPSDETQRAMIIEMERTINKYKLEN